jgi:hypothetical protein
MSHLPDLLLPLLVEPRASSHLLASEVAAVVLPSHPGVEEVAEAEEERACFWDGTFVLKVAGRR